MVKKLKKRRIQGEEASKKDDTILLRNKLTQQNSTKSVSYTHLTLPTIYSV